MKSLDVVSLLGTSPERNPAATELLKLPRWKVLKAQPRSGDFQDRDRSRRVMEDR